MEVEERALKEETDSESQSRLKELQKQLADIKETVSGLAARWDQEKSPLMRFQLRSLN